MALERSATAKHAKSTFFEHKNDIDIFVEDTEKGTKKIYSELLKRVLGDSICLDRVFPLGDRHQVIESCKSDQDYGGRPRLYVVDGDFSVFTPISPFEGLLRLYVLPAYCHENILLDENAFVSFLDNQDVEKDAVTLKALFDFEKWVADNGPKLMDLFIEYAVAIHLHPDIQTVGYKVSNLVSSANGYVDDDKITDRINSVKADIIELKGQEAYENKRKEILDYVSPIKAEDIFRYVSGKDYLFPLLYNRTRTIVDTKPQKIIVKLNLAKKCNVSILGGVFDCLVNAGTPVAIA